MVKRRQHMNTATEKRLAIASRLTATMGWGGIW